MILIDFNGPTFSLSAPADWVISASAQFQAIFLAPPSDAGLRPNLTVALRAVRADVTASGLAQEAQRVQSENYPDYAIIEEVDYTKDGGNAFVRTYRWRSDEVNAVILQAQMFVVQNGTLHTLTATALDGDKDRVFPIFRQMFTSFRLTQPLSAEQTSAS